MIVTGQHVDISLVLTECYGMRALSQMRLLNDVFGKSKGNKRTWANPMGSQQWKSPYEIYTSFSGYICFLFMF